VKVKIRQNRPGKEKGITHCDMKMIIPEQAKVWTLDQEDEKTKTP
jgi:hypothetical protein